MLIFLIHTFFKFMRVFFSFHELFGDQSVPEQSLIPRPLLLFRHSSAIVSLSPAAPEAVCEAKHTEGSGSQNCLQMARAQGV